MAIRNVVLEGDEILRKKCREVTEVTDRIRMTMEDMLETMRSEYGVGIAAPQVGIMRRMFIAEPEPGRVYYMINPVILEQSGADPGDEGCLSVPGRFGIVMRPNKVKITAQDRNGEPFTYEAEGFTARAFCHEIDHLSGHLFTELVSEYIDPEEYYSDGGEN